MFLDNLKLKELRKHYNTEIEAIKQAIINELNRNCNMDNTRRFLYIEELREIDDYFRVEAIYMDYLTSGQMKDKGIYYISKEVL